MDSAYRGNMHTVCQKNGLEMYAQITLYNAGIIGSLIGTNVITPNIAVENRGKSIETY